MSVEAEWCEEVSGRVLLSVMYSPGMLREGLLRANRWSQLCPGHASPELPPVPLEHYGKHRLSNTSPQRLREDSLESLE